MEMKDEEKESDGDKVLKSESESLRFAMSVLLKDGVDCCWSEGRCYN